MNISKLVFLVIILLGLFLRVYMLEVFYPWGHDQDLFAWIAKDIVVDGHFRLIGQETSITGVFIGPIFYYLIAVSFFIFNMNPLSASIITTIISLLTIVSIYYIFSKHFSQKIGLIGAFLYAVSPGVVFLDRWVVPTQPTTLWTIWYLHLLFLLVKGKLQIILASILIGLIWHLHIALIPLLILLPIALLLLVKKEKKFDLKLGLRLKEIVLSLMIFIVLISPFVVFEIRHGFQQTKSLISAVYQNQGDVKGGQRLIKVINSGGRAISGVFLLSGTVIGINQEFTFMLPFLFLTGIFYVWRNKAMTKNQFTIILIWFFIVFFGQFFSKRIITEYYFNNLFVIVFLVFALILSRIPYPVFFLAIYAAVVLIWIIFKPDDMGGYLYKRKAIEFIKSDSLSKGYPCIAINHIEGQKGGATGFRYLFWLNKLRMITPGNDVPVYSIVNPWKISEMEITSRFGNLGVIIPASQKIDPKICSKPERQLLPLWGFTN